MIDSKTRKKLIQELEKNGNVYLSCLKVGINKATYYRWREGDSKFRRLTDKAIRMGRENMCDIAERALLLKVKDKDLGAIKYQLSHNSPRYKPKDKRAYIIHSNDKESEKVIAQKEKERERNYYTGYSDAVKNYLLDDRKKFQAYFEKVRQEHPELPIEVLEKMVQDLMDDDDEAEASG